MAASSQTGPCRARFSPKLPASLSALRGSLLAPPGVAGDWSLPHACVCSTCSRWPTPELPSWGTAGDNLCRVVGGELWWETLLLLFLSLWPDLPTSEQSDLLLLRGSEGGSTRQHGGGRPAAATPPAGASATAGTLRLALHSPPCGGPRARTPADGRATVCRTASHPVSRGPTPTLGAAPECLLRRTCAFVATSSHGCA